MPRPPTLSPALNPFGVVGTLLLALLVACTGQPAAPPPPPASPPNPVNLTVAGATARLLVDRDAVAQAWPVGDRIVQLSPGGAVVIRRGDDFTAERIILGPAPATAIGVGDAGILIGFSDGETATLDPSTGTLRPGAKLATTPRWVGSVSGRPLAAGLTVNDGIGTVHVVGLDDGKTLSRSFEAWVSMLGEAPTAAAASDTALWFGWDWGEWGGALVSMDLRSGQVRAEGARGVYGLSRIRDAVLGFGGIDHIGIQGAWIAHPDNRNPGLFPQESYAEPTGAGPSGPVNQVLPDPAGFTVLSFSDVWHADPTFSSWAHIGTLEVRYRPGRPDAVGTYPAVTSAWYDPEGRLILGTRNDGFQWFTAPDSTTGPEPMVGTGAPIQGVLATDRGVVALLEGVPHLLGADGLEAFDGSFTKTNNTWAFDTDEAGHLRATSCAVGALRTRIWAGTVPSTDLTLAPCGRYSLRDADGTLTVDVSWREPAQVQFAGRWLQLVLPKREPYLFSYLAIPGVPGIYRLRWGGLAKRTVDANAGRIDLIHDKAADAARWGSRTVLLEENRLYAWDPSTDVSTPLPLTLPDNATRLAVDGCGRLWIAGDTLVVAPSETETVPIRADGLDHRQWSSVVALSDGLALTDGAVIAEVHRACAAAAGG